MDIVYFLHFYHNDTTYHSYKMDQNVIPSRIRIEIRESLDRFQNPNRTAFSSVSKVRIEYSCMGQ